MSKAALKLHVQAGELAVGDAMEVLGCPEHLEWARAVAQKGITLVKEQPGVLPLDPAKKRVLYCPHYINCIPTIFISVENPYHLLDVPRVKTFINTYCSEDIVLHELMEKLMGRAAFEGTSPVDAFCGKWDTRL